MGGLQAFIMHFNTSSKLGAGLGGVPFYNINDNVMAPLYGYPAIYLKSVMPYKHVCVCVHVFVCVLVFW